MVLLLWNNFFRPLLCFVVVRCNHGERLVRTSLSDELMSIGLGSNRLGSVADRLPPLESFTYVSFISANYSLRTHLPSIITLEAQVRALPSLSVDHLVHIQYYTQPISCYQFVSCHQHLALHHHQPREFQLLFSMCPPNCFALKGAMRAFQLCKVSRF
jgi:hypothetical protein